MLYIVQFFAEQHTGARCESLVASVVLRDEESDALHIDAFIDAYCGRKNEIFTKYDLGKQHYTAMLFCLYA